MTNPSAAISLSWSINDVNDKLEGCNEFELVNKHPHSKLVQVDAQTEYLTESEVVMDLDRHTFVNVKV